MRPTRQQYISLLLRYLRPQAGQVTLLAVLLVASIGVQLVNPQLMRQFIDAALSNDTSVNLGWLGGMFIGLAIAQQALSVSTTYFSERVGWTATNALRTDLALHCLRLDLSFHKARTPGELIERIDGDVTALANFFSQLVVQVAGSIILLVGVLIVLSAIHWEVAVAFAVFAAVLLGGMIAVRSIAVPYWKADRQAAAELFGFIEERLAGTVDIRSSGARPYVMRRLYGHLRERLRAGSKARIIGTTTWSVPVLGFAIGNGLAFILAAMLYRTQALSLGTAFLIYYYAQMLYYPLNLISWQIEDFQKAGAGIIRIHELFNTTTQLGAGTGLHLPDGPLAVEFERVSFAYEEDDRVLHDVSLCLEAGKVMGLLGRTGSGKTTITRLLARLYDPTSGTVRLNGIDVRDVEISELRRRIGVVTQDVQLFRATVRDNLTFFNPSIQDERLLQALGELGLQEWLAKLPDGLDTMLAAAGSGLSAGEAQLLAFTRVLLKDPGLVILDEASSRLDPATERMVERAISRLLHNRTGIIIAHRLSTVQRADTILILDEGRVVEHGDRLQLAADPSSRFAGLLRTGLEEAHMTTQRGVD